MAGVNMNEINVPVRLKVLQDSINDFQKILDSLQPETKGWKSVNRIIAQMTSEAQRFQVQMSKPFSSEKQFDQAEKSINKLEESAERLKLVMNGLTITDLKLNPEQLKELQQYEKEINDIKTSYKQLQEEVKKKLLDNGNNKALLGAIPDKQTLSRNFSGVQAAVNQHVKDLEKGVEEQKKLFDQLKSNIELGTRATILTSSGQGLTREALGESIYDKFLMKTEDGTLRIKSWSNGITKKALLEEIEKAFDLSPGDLQHLASKKINEINEEFQKMGEKGDLNPFSGIIAKGKNEQSNYNTTLAALEQQLNEYKALQEEINNLQKNELEPAGVINTGKIREVINRMNGLRDTIIGNITANDNYKNSMRNFSTGLNQAKTAIQDTNAEYLRMQNIQNSFNAMKNTVANFMGFYQVLNLTRKAVQEAAQHIKELDTVMNGISIVTDMDTSDLWGQIDQYSKMAQSYGTTIKGAYEVSQIYYQQGLDTANVLNLTNETLKLAKVSGLDYASTTDYMTTALRGFKMEMSEASTVVDVYSNLAANTAVSQEELAVAMSKTASSMESVGSSFEETSAMIATMVAVTRESATNIGSALKSIAARYGEMKSDPLAMTDADGEELVYNKVDAALQSVGITLKDTEGQFRNFTDVITELAEKWDTLESTQQRYIATQFAGNRQQSRFLALISNKDLLAGNIAVAENSADVGTAQALKALDSLESKIEQVRVAYQQFYTTIGVESVWKGFLDATKSVINTLNGMPKLFGKIPVAAINSISIIISLFKNLALKGLSFIARDLMPALSQGIKSGEPEMQQAGEGLFNKLNNAILGKISEATVTGKKIAEAYAQGVNSNLINQNKTITQDQYNSWLNLAKNGNLQPSVLTNKSQDRETLISQISGSGILTAQGMGILQKGSQQEIVNLITSLGGAIAKEGEQAQQATGKVVEWSKAHQTTVGNLLGVAQALQLVALAIPTTTKGGKQLSGVLQAVSGAGIAVLSVFKAIGDAAKLGTAVSMPWLQIASGVMAVISGLMQAFQATSIEAQLEEATAKAEELNNKAKELKANYNTLDTSIKKLQELEKTRYDSAEAAEEYQTAVDKLAETYPLLISSYDEQNHAVLNVNAMEELLAKARDESALATLRAVEAEAEQAKIQQKDYEKKLKESNSWAQKGIMEPTSDSFIKTYIDNYGRSQSEIDMTSLTSYFKNADTVINGLEDAEGFRLASDLTQIFKDYNTATNNADIPGILNSIQSLLSLTSKYGLELEDYTKKYLEEAEQATLDYQSNFDKIDTGNRAHVYDYLNYKYRGVNSQSVLKDSQGLFDRATQYIYDTISASPEKDFSRGHIANMAEEMISAVDTLFVGITSEKKKELEDILEHPEKYNKKDLPDELKNITWITDTYASSAATNVREVNNKLDGLLKETQENPDTNTLLDADEIKSFRQLAEESTTLNLRNLTNAGIKQAQTLKKNGQEPDDFIKQFIDFYNQTKDLPANLRNSLIENFIANGFTKEGLNKTQDWLNSEDIQAQMPKGTSIDLSDMINSFIPNLSLTLQVMDDTLTENLGDLESLFSDFTNGVKGSKLNKTIASAEKLLGVKLSFKNFEQDGEQFILSVESLQTTMTALENKFGVDINQYGAQIDSINKKLSGDAKEVLTSEEKKLILGEEDYSKFFDENGVIKDTTKTDEAYNTLFEKGKTLVTDYNNYIALRNSIFESLTKASKWKQGDYSSLGEGAYEKIQNYAANKESRKEEFYSSPDWANAVESYQSGISSALSDLTTYGLDYVKNKAANKQYKGVDNTKLAKELEGKTNDNIIELTKTWANQAEKSVSEVNSLVIKAIDMQNGLGKNKAAANLISGGSFTGDDLNQFLSSYFPDQDIEQYIDNAGNLKGQLGEIYHFDQATASYKLNDTATFENVIKAYEETFRTTITKGDELYNQLYKEWIDNKIKEADKEDSGKQFASVLSTLSSAKVGTRVSLVDSPELKAALEKMGVKIEDEAYEVMSEYARDNLILALESTDEEVNAVLNPLKENINQKRAKGAAQKGVMSKTFTRENLRNYLMYAGGHGEVASRYSESMLNHIAENRGYTWIEELQQYVLTDYETAIQDYDEMISEAATKYGEDSEYTKQLREARAQVASEFNKDKKYEALSNLLTNYEDAGSYIDDINTQFGIDLRTVEGAVTKVDGKEVIDKDKVKAELETKLGDAADQYSFLFDNLTDQIADTYIDNISKAGTLATTGTSSQVEMEGFKKAFQRIFPNEKPTFIYDALLNSWTLDINDAIRMIKESAKDITFDSEADRQAYIQNQIDNFFAENLDFSKFLAGTATQDEQKKLQSNLQRYFIGNAKKYGIYGGKSVVEDWAKRQTDSALMTLSQGGSEAIKQLQFFKKGKATSDELKAAYEAQIAPIRAAAEVVDSLQVGSFVATEQIDALTKAGFTIENNTVVATAENLTEAYKSLYSQMAETGEATISELNDLAAKGLDSQYKLPRSVSDTLSKGTMSFSELTQLYTNAGKTFGVDTGTTNEAGQAIYDYTAELERLKTEGKIAVDTLGNVKVTNFQGLAAELGWKAGTEEYAAAYSKFVDSVISDRSNTSKGRAKTQLSNLISARVGDTVNVADLPSNIKTKLGIMGSDAIEIMSEAQRDNWILALDATEESDEAVKQAILEAQKSIKAKRNLSTNTAAVVAMKVSQSTAESLATALGQDTTEAARIMEERGYIFNEYTQEWKASTEVLKNLNRDLYIATQSGATAEDIANLEAAYNNLKYELQNQKYNAVQDIVNNYQNLSEESIAAFKTAFSGTKINITDYITTDEWGKNVVDLAALNQKLVEVGYDVNQLFQQEITSIGDAYLKNISTGVSLLSKGTNNLSDIGAFVESYNEVMGTNLTAGQVTYYDEVLKAFTIQPDFIREYIAKQAENLKAQGIIPEDRVDQWIQDNTVELARQNIDIKGFLSGERTQNDINKLGKALETYYEFAEKPFDEIQNLINNDIKGLQQGGAVAVNIAKSINPELTETDLAEIYSSAIKGWNEALSSAENLTIGQVVTGELKQVLSSLNMIDANDVVTSVENMAGVYWQIFHQMQLTAGSTLTELNKAYAKALEAKESKESKSVEMIKNAASMSYTQLGEYLAESGVQLWEVLRQEADYGIEALGGGKVRISDFTAFARAMGWETDTEEYIEAFKSYNDSLINYRNQTKTQMQSELQALSQMTTSGDVNITRIASEYNLEQYLPAEDLEKYNATLKNGILSLNESADIAGLTEKLGQLVIAEGGMTKDELNKLINDIEVQAKLRDSDNKKKINTAAAYKDIFSNYDSLSIEMIGNLATQLGTTYEDIIDKLDLKNQQADGTYKVSLTKLRQIANTAQGELQQQLLEQVADIENNILSSIVSAGEFAREGTSSMSDMQKFINEYNTLTGENATLAESFIYDGALKAFTLTPDMLTKYTDAQKKQLEKLGLSGDAIDQYIKDQTENIQRENINIESLLNAQGTAERNTTATELARQIQQLSNYSDIQKLIGKSASATIDETMNAIYSVLSAGGNQAVELVKAIKGEKVTASDISTAYNAGIERLRTALNELQVHTGTVVSDYTAAILNAVGIETKDLENGTAVVTTLDTNIKVDQLTQAYAALYNALKQNNEKTIADLNTAYAKILTSAESQEINAISTLQNAVSMTWEQLGEILTQEGKQLEEVFNDMAAYGVGSIGAGKVRIYDFTKFAEKMGWDPSSDEYISAYKAYNDGLIALNNQAEKAIVEEVKSLSSAKGGDWLNFTQLWTALQNATKTAIENIAPEDYTGNVDLANRPIVPAETMKKLFKNFEDDYATLYSETFMSEDFGDLQNSVGLLFTSITAAGEPVADLAEYVKGLYDEANGDIEKIRQLDKSQRNLFLRGFQNATRDMVDEYGIDLHNRGAAKDTIRYYNQALENYGARFVDGIFQLDKNANLFGIASTLQDLMDSGVIEIEDGLAEIKDTISGILKAYATAISKGIDGGLTNVEMQDLVQKATDLGLSNIQFEETAEGFKLVETSAIQLYYALKQIDSLQAGQIFDKLRESLEKTNENFKSSSALAAHIANIRNGTYAADDKISQARKDQYQAELDIAKEILAVRATSEDSSFNFMSNSIPAAQNNPLNYFSNWASAIEKIKTAMKTTTKDTKGKSHKGLIDYQDWYNIVTEMNNIAALGGEFEVAGIKLNGSMEAASKLIQKGAEALIATKTGKLQVAMGDIGVEFKKGAGGMKQGIDDGIKAMAQSQIDMLDGMIQMLETIVAMEKLGDIAGENDVIDVSDIFPDIQWDENGKPIANTFNEFSENYKKYRSIVDYIIETTKTNKDLEKGLNNLKINNKSIKEIFDMSATELANMGKDFNEAYTAALQAIVTAARSGNYDENNVMQSLQEVFAESGLNNITLDTGKMAIVLSGGNISTVSWEDENVKSLLKKYTKDKITTAMQNFLSGTVTQQEIEIALTVKGVYKFNEKGEIDSIEWDGRQYDVNTEAFKKAQAAHLLKQLKVITDEKEFDLSKLTGSNGQYTTTYTIAEGQRNIRVKINSDENGTTTTFHSNITDEDYNSAQELFVKEYDYLANEEYKKAHDNQTATEDQLKDFKKSSYTYDMYMWQENRIHTNVKTVIQTGDGKTIDLNSQGSAAAREDLLKLYNKSPEEFKQWAQENAKINDAGDITITTDQNFTVIVNGKGIVKTDGETQDYDTSELQAAVGKELLGVDLSLQENIAGGIVKGISSLGSSFGEAATTAGSLADAMERISSAAQMLQNTQWGVIAEGIKSLNSPKEQQKNSSSSSDSQTSSTETTNVTTIVTKFEPDTKAVENAKEEISNEPATMKVNSETEAAISAGEEARRIIDAMSASINITTTGNAASAINSITNALRNLTNGGRPYLVNVQARVTPPSGPLVAGSPAISATGTLGLAKSKGTLMGELGPELVVSKGRYFVVGQNGPEMVDLDDDAIVFNHLQTQSLLTKGMSNGRGRAVTNERNAVSFATGNVDGGPAMASAAAALATLKQLRAMWESLLNASVSDIAGGGGGGGGGGNDKIVDPKAWVKTVERWYNLTQEIAKLEKDITHEETLRSKLQSDFSKNGTHYYNSQRLSLKALREQIAAQEQLNLSRQDYYTKRIDALKNEPLGKLYTFDEQGQMHFRDDVTMNGQKGAMNFLTDLMGFDENGKANYTNEQKYNILKQYGFDEYMKYNSNGEQIILDADHSGDVTDEERETYYQQATEAWRDRMDNFASETQSLWDSIQEGENNLLELQTSQNEILQEMRDNQIEVEEDVLKAIEDMRQREIDALQDERDKLEDSTGKYIEGLSDALSKEQEMYDNQQQENNLNQQRRRLAILQRSGGSAADIANLQNEINSNERSRYFDLQQQQIDAIQQASDLQLERMDNQIELMTETLEYQKEYGLLWSEVYDVMSHSAAQITSFIMNGNSEFWAKSPLGSATSSNETLFKAEQWIGFREDMTDVTTDVAALAFATREQMKANDYKIYNDAMVNEFGSNYDSTGKYKGIFEQVYNETGDLTKASAAARAEYQKDKKEEETKKLKTTTTTISTPAPSSADSSSGSSNNNKCKGCAGECTKGCAYSCTGKCDKGCKGVCGTDCERGCASGCKESCKGKCTTECYSSCLGGCKGSSSFSAQTYTSSLPKKAKGGFVKHGIYELGEEGTEGVLNAHQTRILRDNILSNKPNSLITLLNTYNEAYKDGISVAPQEASGQLIIENATVNMNVEQIANDYDARRAGEQALNEMMRIARKTGAANSIRR